MGIHLDVFVIIYLVLCKASENLSLSLSVCVFVFARMRVCVCHIFDVIPNNCCTVSPSLSNMAIELGPAPTYWPIYNQSSTKSCARLSDVHKFFLDKLSIIYEHFVWV